MKEEPYSYTKKRSNRAPQRAFANTFASKDSQAGRFPSAHLAQAQELLAGRPELLGRLELGR